MEDSKRARTHVETPDPIQPHMSGARESIRADHFRARIAELPALLKVSHIRNETGMSRATIYRKLETGEIRSVRPTPHTRAVPIDWYVEWVEGLMADATRAAQ